MKKIKKSWTAEAMWDHLNDTITVLNYKGMEQKDKEVYKLCVKKIYKERFSIIHVEITPL